MGKSYWVHLDFGGDHTVVRTDNDSLDGDWDGPFDTWTEAKDFMWETAMNELDEIRSVRDGWADGHARSQVVEDTDD